LCNASVRARSQQSERNDEREVYELLDDHFDARGGLGGPIVLITDA
jgi:hypothetical protein